MRTWSRRTQPLEPLGRRGSRTLSQVSPAAVRRASLIRNGVGLPQGSSWGNTATTSPLRGRERTVTSWTARATYAGASPSRTSPAFGVALVVVVGAGGPAEGPSGGGGSRSGPPQPARARTAVSSAGTAAGDRG